MKLVNDRNIIIFPTNFTWELIYFCKKVRNWILYHDIRIIKKFLVGQKNIKISENIHISVKFYAFAEPFMQVLQI
jgi:hypothetical protein